MKRNNPIQVILNSERFKSIPETNKGGRNTDFYADRDEAFIKHKHDLMNEVAHVQEQLRQSGFELGLVKVELNPQALAKSHRPDSSLFPNDKSPVVGSLGIGELLIQVTQKTLSHLQTKISGTEETTRKAYDEVLRKWVPKPSTAKSEAGAIDTISFYGSEEKISFSQEDWGSWQADGNESFAGYQVELVNFRAIDTRMEIVTPEDIRVMHLELTKKLQVLGTGVYVTRLSQYGDQANAIMVQLLNPIGNDFTVSFDERLDKLVTPNDIDMNPVRHKLLLSILSASPLVKKVMLPPKISRAQPSLSAVNQSFSFPVKNGDHDYPRVGIIDSGVHNVNLSEWCVSVSNGFDSADCDPDHGSQVASLLVCGNALNPKLNNIDDDGCLLFDIWIPVHNGKSNTFTNYFSDPGEFFDWLDLEVGAAVKKGFRIFNFSLNFREFVRDDSYSFAAVQIDRISRKYDILFVISSGNLRRLDFRRSWSPETTPLHLSDIDRISQPAEAVSAITVGAINPPGSDTNLHGAPTVYTRRGPGVAMGVKPDVIHYGGFTSKTGSGMVSIDGSGGLVEEAGTSFSAPLVSKILASLNQRTYGRQSRNALVAMLVHHSNFTVPLSHKKMNKSLARRFAGFGMPLTSRDMLHSDDHCITLVLSGHLNRSEVMEFDFDWPRSLTNEGSKCAGKATLTVAYDPVIDQNYGAEYCRVNVDAVLQQQKFDPKKEEWVFRKNCDSIWEDRLGKEANYEKSQIEHGLKWWPVKKYVKNSPRGVGESNQWRLRISSMERSTGEFPAEGINFTAILSIEDTLGRTNDLFNEVRNELNAIGIAFEDIKVSQQVNIRSGQ